MFGAMQEQPLLISRLIEFAANALDRAHLPAGSRVGTLAWNGYRHFELYFGVSGSERVLHTINPRPAP